MDSNTTNTALAILTGALVLITAFYAYLTSRVAKANEAAVEAMKSQSRAAIRPFLTITHFLDSNTLIHLIVRNSGRTNAEKVRLSIDKPFLQAAGYKDLDIAKSYAFTNEIPTWSPGTEVRYSLISSAALGQVIPEQPFVFTVTAEYSFFGERVVENTIIDLNTYDKSFLPTQSTDESLRKLADEIKSIREFLLKRFAS